MRCVMPLLAALLLGFAPIPFPRVDRTKADLKKIQGEWVRVSHAVDGNPLSPAVTILVIAGDRLEYGEHPGKEGWKVVLNARTMPKRFDRAWRQTQLLPSACWIGVYSLEGDTLTICSVRNGDEEDRPKNLDGKLPGQVWKSSSDKNDNITRHSWMRSSRNENGKQTTTDLTQRRGEPP